MLSPEQKKLIIQGLSVGMADTQIADEIADVTQMQVFKLREKLGMTREDVLENRYNAWIRLIESGVGPEAIAELYKVKPVTIVNTLYRKKNFSYAEAKRKFQREKDSRFVEATRARKKGVFDW